MPLISQRQKGHPVPWPSDSCNTATCRQLTGHWSRYSDHFSSRLSSQLIATPQPKRPRNRTCQAVRQEVHIRCPQGSIFTSLSFSAQILQSWNVEPISQYSSYCSWRGRQIKLGWVYRCQRCNITVTSWDPRKHTFPQKSVGVFLVESCDSAKTNEHVRKWLTEYDWLQHMWVQ